MTTTKDLNLKKTAELGLATASLLTLLAACGGNSSGGGAADVFQGSAIKGPVSAATVNIDSNDDGVCGGAGDAAAVTTNGDGVFTFPTVSAVAHTVCVTGGTDTVTGADLTGTTLTAPPSATPVVTPLTTLVDSQIRAVGGNVHSPDSVANVAGKIAGALGVTSSQVVPATTADALTVEATANAVQALLSGTSRVITSAASGVTATSMFPAASRGSALAIWNASTTTGLTLPITKEAIRQAVIQAQAESGVSASVSALCPAMVSEIAGPALDAHLEGIEHATPENLQSVVANEHAKIDEMVAAMSQISSLMTCDVATALNVGANPAATNGLATAVASAAANGLPAAAAELETAANQAVDDCAAHGVPLHPIIVTMNGTIKGIVLSAPQINNATVTTTTQPFSVTVAGPLSSASLNVVVSGNPELEPEKPAIFRAIEVGGGNRELWLYIDKVNMAHNNGTLSVTVPASAKLYAYGKNRAGVTFSAVLANEAANVLTSANNVLTVDWTAAKNALAGQTGFANLDLATGTFDVTVAMKGSSMYMDNASVITPVPAVAVTAPAAAGFPNGGGLSGKGITIRVTAN
ncbi:MAG: hypothetical protein Q7U91_01640 [Sideroxyarcus sp.]|nr:hypothetical protein [Sideroxyarcus sp.]